MTARTSWREAWNSDEHELHTAGAGGVRLHAGDAEAEVGGRHHGQPAVLEPQPVARTVLDLSCRLPPKRSLDRLESIADLEDRLDVLLGQVEGHGGKPMREAGGALLDPSRRLVERRADCGRAAPHTEMSRHRPDRRRAHEPLLVSQPGDLVLCRGVCAHRVGE